MVGLCFGFEVDQDCRPSGWLLGLLLFTDHYTYAMETLAIIFVCTVICVFGVPLGIHMSEDAQRAIRLLDMLQTRFTFVN